MLSRRVLPGACRVLPVLIAAVGTLEYLAIDLPHLGRSLVFLYVASAVLLLNQRYPLASPLAALGVLVVFSLVDPLAATEGNTTLLLAMFSLFVVAAFNSGRVAVLGGLFGLACLAVVALRAPEWDISGLVVLVLLLLIAWGAGRLSALRDRIAQRPPRPDASGPRPSGPRRQHARSSWSGRASPVSSTTSWPTTSA